MLRSVWVSIWSMVGSGLPKVIFLAVAEGEDEGGKTFALEVEAEGEAKGLVICIKVFVGIFRHRLLKALVEIM